MARCVWADMLEPTTADVWARYTNEWYAPYAAITRNPVGKGQAIYVGAGLDDAFYAQVRAAARPSAGVSGLLSTPPGVQVKARIVGGQPLLFVLNCTTEAKTVTLPRPMHDVLLDRAVGKTLQLLPRDVVALR